MRRIYVEISIVKTEGIIVKIEGKLFPEVGMGSREKKDSLRVHLCQIKESNERETTPVQLCKGKVRDDTD